MLVLLPRLQHLCCLLRKEVIPSTLHQSVTVQFQALFTPISGFFSAFSRDTNSLSVSGVYLELDVDPPIFMPHT